MNRSTAARVLLILAALAGGAGCSPESRAKTTLGKYEAAFRICKEQTEKAAQKPGQHRCALVTSMAVDMSLHDSGLDEAKTRQMLGEWLDTTGYRPFYVPPEKRAIEHR